VVIVATDVERLVAGVVDPEIPVLTIADLGVLRSVELVDSTVVVTITPTYSGCPAMRQIEDDISSALLRGGVDGYEIRVTHDPPWTTDRMTEEGRRKLAEFGIAPPGSPEDVLCPQCRAHDPRLVAHFAGVACQALLVCSSCGEPFKLFKTFR
jgi:ring-1,2-phenylacetyl-CoA epoxidase subunit PaaD